VSSTNPSGISQAAHQTTKAVWAATFVIVAGTIVAGIALIEWIWPMFWAGIAMVVLGGVGALAAGVMDEVSEYGPPSA
jgi:hypothetical protein